MVMVDTGVENDVAVVGFEKSLTRKHGVATLLRRLGATVRTIALDIDPLRVADRAALERSALPLVMVFEALERPELVVRVRRTHFCGRPSACATLLVVLESDLHRVSGETSAFDDLLLVPCSTAELYARMRGLGWQTDALTASGPDLRLDGIAIDHARRTAAVGGSTVALSPREFSLLVELCAHLGRAVSRERLLDRVWGKRGAGRAAMIDVYVSRLRTKLGPGVRIETLRGFGYRLRAPRPMLGVEDESA